MSIEHYPRAEAIGASKASVEEYAEAFAAAYAFRPGGALELLVAHLKGEIGYKTTFDDGDGSLYVHGPSGGAVLFTIYCSSFSGARRNRFTIAHELGHFALHSACGQKQIQAARQSKSEPVEWEANWFAAALLMPRAPFLEACEMERVGEDVDWSAVADRFAVSFSAAQVRGQVLGVRG